MTLVFTDRNLVPNATAATSLLSTELQNSNLNVIPGTVVAGPVRKRNIYLSFLFLFFFLYMDFFENSNINAELPLPSLMF